MSEITPEEAIGLLQEPRTIWSPYGAKFELRPIINTDGMTIEQVGDVALLVQYELRGPDEHKHLWIASWDGEIVANPLDDDVPKSWTAQAQVALDGYLKLDNKLNP